MQPLQLTPLDVEEECLYSEVLPCDQVPHPAFLNRLPTHFNATLEVLRCSDTAKWSFLGSQCRVYSNSCAPLLDTLPWLWQEEDLSVPTMTHQEQVVKNLHLYLIVNPKQFTLYYMQTYGFRNVCFHSEQGTSFVWSVCLEDQKPVFHAASKSLILRWPLVWHILRVTGTRSQSGKAPGEHPATLVIISDRTYTEC